MIQSITMRGIKGANTVQELTGRDIIIGANGAGKTTRAQALGIALMGHVPGNGKLPAETMKLAAGNHMMVGIETAAFNVTRTFERKGAKVEQSIAVSPSFDEKTATEKEQRIERELGKLPVMLDFNEFLSLSDMKRREFIYSLAGQDDEFGNAHDRHFIGQILRERLQLPVTADPKEIEALDEAIEECLMAFDNAAVGDNPLQTGLSAALKYAKEQHSLWKKETEKAAGASQKISEYKNDLETTDRTLDADNARLEQLHKESTEAAAVRAQAERDNSHATVQNDRIAALQKVIAEIEASTNMGNAPELRELITQYSGDIKQVNNQGRIQEAALALQHAQAHLPAMEKSVTQLREDYTTTNAKITANEKLINSLKNHQGQCPIDSRMSCHQDFTEFLLTLGGETQQCKRELEVLKSKGIQAGADLEQQKSEVALWQAEIDRLRQEETAALRENEDLQKVIRELEGDLQKAENFDTDKAAQLAAKREALNELMPVGGGRWPLADLTPLAAKEVQLAEETRTLKAKIAEQTKARNALATLKNTMLDSTICGYRAEAWKRIAEVVGPKGLQGELVKDVLAPLSKAIQEKLEQMGIGDRAFYFQTADEKGKELFQFGWAVLDHASQTMEQRNFDALSTGEQLLLLIALMTTIIERINPPLKVLVIDNAESLDKGNFRRVINGLTTAGQNMDNIIFSGVMDVGAADAEGWHVWKLDGGAE